MKARDKITAPHDIQGVCGLLRRQGRRVVFTNGCFDILHIGHVRYLEAARDQGDALIVGVNSDASVRQIKGPGRPIVEETQRAELVAALHCVDYVTLFDAPDPLELIKTISPDVLVKGADWPEEKIIGREAVMRSGGTVTRIPFVQGASTTTIIERIVASFSNPMAPR